MSERIQTLTPSVAGKASTTAFVNVYQSEDGNIYFGSKTFRQRKNANRKGLANVGGNYVETLEINAEISLG
jgi:hypothetical protein